MWGGKGRLGKLGWGVPLSPPSRRGARKKVDGGGDFVTSEGIRDPSDVPGLRVRLRGGGKEVETSPSIGGVLTGEPDRLFFSDDENMLAQRCWGWSRVGSLGKAKTGGACGAKGARGTKRIFRKAEEGAEFHQGLIVSAGIFSWDEGGGDGTKFQKGGGASSAGEEPTQNAGHVSVEGRCGDVECDAGNRPCRVVADSRKLKKFLGVGGETAVGKLKNGLGEGVKRAGTAVVAESLP